MGFLMLRTQIGNPKPTKEARVTYHLSKTLVLVGLMGAGKTAIGSLVAGRLGVDFVDSDEEIVRAANMSIAEIFERDGEPFFRQKESQVIERLLTAKPHVLSTGGGAFLSQINRDIIAASGVSVWFHAELETLWLRVKDKGTRPLLMVPNPKEKLRELYETRNPMYAMAQITVKGAKRQSKEAMVDRVMAALLADPNSGVTRVDENA
jgi:shikimate kinase